MASGCAEEKRDNLEGRLVHRSLSLLDNLKTF